MTTALPRALAATVIAVVPENAQEDAASILIDLAQTASIRPIVVSLGEAPEAEREERNGAIVIRGLVPKYLNNAVASLRLSSLPSVGWWRSHHAAPLHEFAVLVDRLVLDVDDPIETWSRVPDLAALTAVSDLRWGRLTRWRDLLAQFLDVPDIRNLTEPFDRLEIAGADGHLSALLAGWLKARLPGGQEISVHRLPAEPRLERVHLTGAAGRATLRLLPNGSCIEAAVRTATHRSQDCRVVPLGDHGVGALLTDELRIRSRDLAFEEAVQEAIAL